ncbi:MAG: 1-deoxy-D-xylulose-5-phosphate synthase, partial [Actinomycetia bacterium]|nr:1-deoxy-D-xylulose-5-phosphate synthase [Actinomycetes bacterium]
MWLEKIDYPSDLKKLSLSELRELAGEIRQFMVESVSKTGGHLAPNLGVVEITIALHYVLNTPADKIVWDVGHQTYVHKILTGRKNEMRTLRQYGGISGFPKRSESEYDVFDTGHASNSISIALGLAVARDMKHSKETVVALIGDGSLTGGIAFEAMNQAGHIKTNLTVVLNDNEMSIAKNVGAISSYLSRIRIDPLYNRIRDEIEEKIKKIPGIGEKIFNVTESFMESMKNVFVPGLLFEELGFTYIGPIDGHNIERITTAIALAKKMKGPVLIHALTKKGLGYLPAEKCPDRFHGISPFSIEKGETKKSKIPSYTEVFGKTLVELGKNNKKIIAVTAAMREGTGLNYFAEKYPDRFFDVGIAEQHAVTFAAGLASEGMKPFCAIYSTFLQRGYDQVVHDVAIQNLPVRFAIDRAGLVGADGPTHAGA